MPSYGGKQLKTFALFYWFHGSSEKKFIRNIVKQSYREPFLNLRVVWESPWKAFFDLVFTVIHEHHTKCVEFNDWSHINDLHRIF